MGLIRDAVEKLKESRIKRNPAYTVRASSLGYYLPELDGCVRRGVFDIKRWQDKKLHDVRLQAIFDEGNEQEKIVLAELAKAGIMIVEQQSAFSIPDIDGSVLITGHIDGVILESNDSSSYNAYPIEIKSMNPNIFAKVNSEDDLMLKSWTKAYLAQIQIYMKMKNATKAYFILKDKSNGTIKEIEVFFNPELYDACERVAREINQHVKADTYPDRISDIDKCKMCSFNHICLPDIDFGKELQIHDDKLFEDKLDRYFELEDAKKEAVSLYKDSISPKMKATAQTYGGTLNVLLGKYHLTGKTSIDGTFRPKIKLIDEDVDD
jgi:CRISPR/Cas system-associated exonuclease Cas4 (RecB family)